MRGTCKFNQHKSAEDIEATIAGQRGAGRERHRRRHPQTRPGRMTRLAIFDCDGTLVDSGATIVNAVAETFAQHGIAGAAAKGLPRA